MSKACLITQIERHIVALSRILQEEEPAIHPSEQGAPELHVRIHGWETWLRVADNGNLVFRSDSVQKGVHEKVRKTLIGGRVSAHDPLKIAGEIWKLYYTEKVEASVYVCKI